jgi:hypothetical protein
MSEQIRFGLAGADRMLSEVMTPIFSEATRDKSPAEAEAIGIVLVPILSAISTLTETPIALEVNWPAGVPADIRATLRAQLQSELEQLTRRRIHQEFQTLIGILPALASSLVKWIQAIAAQQAVTPP